MGKNKKKGEASPSSLGSLAPTTDRSPISSPVSINSNRANGGSQIVATLYVFYHSRRIVAIGIGQVPPDTGDLCYDSLLRIPIVNNGDKPSWRAFIWHTNESITRAMARAGNPIPRKRKVPR